ncbi:LOW QUALITY PROTEIN: hypothetical protein HID58_048070 [Brassica napus]|uniref:Uncharacterized protein n=1 Tax=Brassica napus TaxID=3708 RepID=A0ABQ8B132_BRANA|nr:LOW QUALITY PROTEIN: hypothetical protein HID58_048070 [Brassica napus]
MWISWLIHDRSRRKYHDDQSPSSYHSVVLSTNHLRKRDYIHSFIIYQPQPSRGKKRRILTRFKPHTAGNTSSREDNTTLNRSNKIQHRNYQMVPTSSCWFRVLSSHQTFCSPWFLLVPGLILRSDPRSLRICRLQVSTSKPASTFFGHCWCRVSTAKHASTTVGFNIPNQGQSPPTSGSQAVDATDASRLIIPPHMRKMQGSQAEHNIFRPGLQLGRIPKTGGVIRRAPGNTAGPLQTPGETQDMCLSKSPRLHPSTSCKKRKFPVKGSRIRQSTRKSSCARALVPRSLQDKSTGPPREVASTPQQRSPFLQGPVTGLRTLYPADERQSSLKHQQVHLRRTLHHWEKTYVSYKTGKQILSSTEIQDQGPESYKITFEQVQNLEVLIKTPVYHLEKRLSSRPKKKSEKGKQRPVHYKHAEMERLRLAKLHMLSPDFTHEIER